MQSVKWFVEECEVSQISGLEENKPMEEQNNNTKKKSFAGAIIMFGIAPVMYLWLLYQAFLTNQATPFVILVFGGMTLGSWWLLYYVIQQSKKPPVVLTPEQQALKEEKEGRQAVVVTPILCLVIMYLQHNYSSWILWTVVGFCFLGWVQFLPKTAQDVIGKISGGIFGGIWQIVKWGLLIILAVLLFHGLAAMSTTTFLLLIIIWQLSEMQNKNN